MPKDIDEKIKNIDKESIKNIGFTPEEQEKNLKLIKCQYDMHKKTIKEIAPILKSRLDKNGKRIYSDSKIEEQIALIQHEIDDTVDKYEIYGGDPNDLTGKTSSNRSILDKLKKLKSESPITEKIQPVKDYVPNNKTHQLDTIYDIIPLPSNGECYSSKMGNVSVAYLDARDENIIVSPNLYNENRVFDVLLKRKVFNNEVEIGDMLDGDREAIILYLRISGFGNEYPIIATDNSTGKSFNTVLDLNKIKPKRFTLVGDENGYFDYALPISGTKIKFKFLTHNDNVMLKRLNDVDNKINEKSKLKEIIDILSDYVKRDETVTSDLMTKINTSINYITQWHDLINEDDDGESNRSVTNRVELEIVEVEGNKDRDYIHDFVEKMNIKDLTSFIKFYNENEPGLNYNIEIEKPESLGGGSMNVFLQLDQYLFLNTTL